MHVILPVHITAGLIGIVSGAIALSALKGARLHRKSGLVFVCAMAILAATGAIIATLKHQQLNAMQGIFTFYLVTTALLTVRRPANQSRRLDVGATLLVLALGVAYFRYGMIAARSETGKFDGYPAAMFFIFGAVAVLAAVGDVRMLRAGGVEGRRRLTRHLWRMCFALFIATGSFFLGQAQVFPEPIRIMPLLAVPVVTVLLVMVYWLWRVGIRRKAGGIRLAGEAASK